MSQKVKGKGTDKGQMSESRRLAVLLAVSGGFMDAYTYIFRGGVFANAQTGNILLFGVHCSEGDYQNAFHYFFPVLAFAFGIILSELIRRFCVEDSTIHWRQHTIMLECIILFLVGFVPIKYNLAANALVSFACGIQVESFRKVKGNASATTMCIGNLRSGTQDVCDYLFTRDKKCLLRGGLYYGIILAFTLGAVLGNIVIGFWTQKAIWCSCILLFAGFLLMFRQKKKPKYAGQ